MRTETGKMPASFIFPIGNRPGESDERFGFIWYGCWMRWHSELSFGTMEAWLCARLNRGCGCASAKTVQVEAMAELVRKWPKRSPFSMQSKLKQGWLRRSPSVSAMSKQGKRLDMALDSIGALALRSACAIFASFLGQMQQRMSAVLEAPKARYRLAIGVFFFLQGFTFASWAARIPDFKEVFGLNEGQLGTLLLAFPLGQLLGVPLSGYLVERFTSRRTLLSAAFLYPFTLTCLGFIPFMAMPGGGGPMPFWTVYVFSAVLFLLGLVANLHNLSVNTQAVGLEKEYGRSIMGTFHGCWSLAGFVSGIVGSFMAAHSIVPFFHYAGVLAFGLIVLLCCHRHTLKQDIVSETAKGDKPTFNIFKGVDNYVFLLGFLAFASMLCEGTMYDWSAIYFDQEVGVGKEYIRFGYTACMLAMAAYRFLADGIVNRFGPVFIMRLSGLMTAGGFLLMVIAPLVGLSGTLALVVATVGSSLVGLGVSSVVPICYGAVSRHKGVVAGRAINAVSTIGFFGFVMGPPVIGHLAQWIGLPRVFVLVALLGLSMALFAGKLKGNR